MLDTIRALQLIRSYQTYGHFAARLDPLGIENRPGHPELDPATHGFVADDFDRSIFVGGALGLENATLRQILDLLTRTYATTIGVEFMHIQDPKERAWIQEKCETPRPTPVLSEKIDILQSLCRAVGFEPFSIH